MATVAPTVPIATLQWRPTPEDGHGLPLLSSTSISARLQWRPTPEDGHGMATVAPTVPIATLQWRPTPEDGHGGVCWRLSVTLVPRFNGGPPRRMGMAGAPTDVLRRRASFNGGPPRRMGMARQGDAGAPDKPAASMEAHPGGWAWSGRASAPAWVQHICRGHRLRDLASMEAHPGGWAWGLAHISERPLVDAGAAAGEAGHLHVLAAGAIGARHQNGSGGQPKRCAGQIGLGADAVSVGSGDASASNAASSLSNASIMVVVVVSVVFMAHTVPGLLPDGNLLQQLSQDARPQSSPRALDGPAQAYERRCGRR